MLALSKSLFEFPVFMEDEQIRPKKTKKSCQTRKATFNILAGWPIALLSLPWIYCFTFSNNRPIVSLIKEIIGQTPSILCAY